MIRFVSVAALSDEAPSLIASHPKGRCCNTGDASRLGAFCVSGDRTPHDRKRTTGRRGRKRYRYPAVVMLAVQIRNTPTVSPHLQDRGRSSCRVGACRFRATGLNLGFLTIGVGGAFG